MDYFKDYEDLDINEKDYLKLDQFITFSSKNNTFFHGDYFCLNYNTSVNRSINNKLYNNYMYIIKYLNNKIKGKQIKLKYQKLNDDVFYFLWLNDKPYILFSEKLGIVVLYDEFINIKNLVLLKETNPKMYNYLMKLNINTFCQLNKLISMKFSISSFIDNFYSKIIKR